MNKRLNELIEEVAAIAGSAPAKITAALGTYAQPLSGSARAQRFTNEVAHLHSKVEACQARAARFVMALPPAEVERWRDAASDAHSEVERAALEALIGPAPNKRAAA